MTEMVTYTVPGMECDHCKASVTEELSAVPGVESVDVDLKKKMVVVRGEGLDNLSLRAAIGQAGYEAS